ncbi:serine/threonine protein phosphatase, partial [Phocaeicola vulgatus]|nr:serine/threonine protein phosphatase [Phocaeicola vulgatus]
VINACNHSILCVGGAISIDRTYRLEAWSKEQQKRLRFSNTEVVDDFSPSYYWQSESPTYNKEALMSILSEQKVDIVITHTSPSFCELLSKEGIAKWTCNDKTLISDIQQEREVMNSLYETLKEHQQHVTHWCYGHFHQSWHSSIDGTLFKMLDIMEFYELK